MPDQNARPPSSIAEEFLSRRLIAARRAGRPLSSSFLTPPADLAAAARVQSLVAGALGPPAVGWKLALHPDGRTAVAAPLRPLVADGHAPAQFPWRPGTGVEVELAFRIDELPETDAPADLGASLGPAILGVEVTGGGLAEGNQAPFLLFLADMMDNAGYVVGPQLPDGIVARVTAGEVAIQISGAAAWSGTARHAAGSPLAPLDAYAHDGGRCWDLSRSLVTTGSLSGLVPVTGPGRVEIVFDGGPVLWLEFGRADPA